MERIELAAARGNASVPLGECHIAPAYSEVLVNADVVNWLLGRLCVGAHVEFARIALCAAPDQAATMPIEGGFYGDGVASTLEYDVQIATG